MEETLDKTLRQIARNTASAGFQSTRNHKAESASQPHGLQATEWPAHKPGGNNDEPLGKEHNPGVIVIGAGISLRGDGIICKNLIVSGKLEASASCSRMKILETGTVYGKVTASDAEIRGTFEGTLNVKGCLTIHPGATVFGKITYAGLRIFQDGKLLGDIRHETSIESLMEIKDPAGTSSSIDSPNNKILREIVRNTLPDALREGSSDPEAISTKGESND